MTAPQTAPLFDTIVRGDRIVLADRVVAGGVGIVGERIAAVLDPNSAHRPELAARVIDATGKIVIPGVIDSHVHHRTLNANVDDWTNLTRGAALGGVTTVIPFIQPPAGRPFGEMVDYFRDEGERDSIIDFAMHWRVNAPSDEAIEQLTDVVAKGVPSVKLFMAYRKRGIMWDGPPLIKILERIKHLGGIVCVHAEDGDLIDRLEDEHIQNGQYNASSYLASRPHNSELSAASRIILLAEQLECPLYIVHTSVGDVLPAADAARRRDAVVYIETCPQYLTLTDEDTRKWAGRAKIAPPLRYQEDNGALWEGLAHGEVHTVGSDHSPYEKEKKLQPPEKWMDIPFGAPGVQTLLPILYSEGVAKGRISLTQLVEVLCAAPSRIFGLSPRKGQIVPGADADLVVIDPDVTWTLEDSSIVSEAGYTNWHGWKMQGKPIMSMVRGTVAMENGVVHAPAGHGVFLPRRPSH
jgi:dihydropyrimidinase